MWELVHEELVCSISRQTHLNLILCPGIPKTTAKLAHFHWRFHSSNLEPCPSPLDETSTTCYLRHDREAHCSSSKTAGASGSILERDLEDLTLEERFEDGLRKVEKADVPMTFSGTTTALYEWSMQHLFHYPKI